MTDPRHALAARIRALGREYFALGEPPGARGEAKAPLHMPGYGAEEVDEAIASLLSTRVTMGEKVRPIGNQHAIGEWERTYVQGRSTRS